MCDVVLGKELRGKVRGILPWIVPYSIHFFVRGYSWPKFLFEDVDHLCQEPDVAISHVNKHARAWCTAHAGILSILCEVIQ